MPPSTPKTPRNSHSEIKATPFVDRGGPDGKFYAFIKLHGAQRQIGYGCDTEDEAMQIAKAAAYAAPYTDFK